MSVGSGAVLPKCVARLSNWSNFAVLTRVEDRREMRKAVPDRYPSNTDSIGVELVGEALPLNGNPDRRTYVAAPEAQNDSLRWLVHALSVTLRVPVTEVFVTR